MLLVDLSQVPHPHLAHAYWGIPEGTHEGSLSRLPLDALFVALGRIGAVAVGQKLMLVAIVFLAGWGMHRLAPGRGTSKAFAGLLYSVNPFVYDRLNAGQWFLLLGYALIPHAFRAFTRALAGDGTRPWRFAWLAFATAIASTHMFALLVALCIVTATVNVVAATPRVAVAGRAGLALALSALPCLYWLIPTPGIKDFLRHIGHAQLSLYGTVGDPTWGRIATVLGLYGFWNDPDPIRDYLAVWPLLGAALLALALWGLVVARHDRTAWGIALTGGFACLVALGKDSPITGSAFLWSFDHISIARAFREPQKWVALVAFAYAYLGAAAVEDLFSYARVTSHRAAVAVSAFLLTLPLLYGYRSFWGLWGSLHTSTFPRSWREADGVLRREARASQTLFLPWHGYFALGFAHHRVVANVGPQYFRTPILASRSVGEGAALADNSDPLERYVSTLLASGSSRTDLGACFAQIGVSHILLAKEADYARYPFLARQRDLVLERRWPDLVLYRNTVPSALVMDAPAAKNTRPCRPRTELPVPATRKDPVHFELRRSVPKGSMLVLALAYRRWELGSQRSRPYLRAVNRFRGPAASNATIELTTWRDYRRNYGLGAAGVIALSLSGLGAAVLARRRAPPRN